MQNFRIGPIFVNPSRSTALRQLRHLGLSELINNLPDQEIETGGGRENEKEQAINRENR
jgi:hypothetical protein